MNPIAPSMTTASIQCRNKRIEQHLNLVAPIASGFARRTGHNSDDLVQVGMLGLIKAAERFDQPAAVPFSAFARPHIRGAILHYLRDQASLVRLPRRIEERAQQLLRDGGDTDRPDDAMVLWQYRSKNRWADIPEQWSSTTGTGLESLHTRDRYQALNAAMRKLPKQQRQAVHAVVLQGKSLRNAGSALGVSAMTVQRRLKQGLKTLSETAA